MTYLVVRLLADQQIAHIPRLSAYNLIHLMPGDAPNNRRPETAPCRAATLPPAAPCLCRSHAPATCQTSRRVTPIRSQRLDEHSIVSLVPRQTLLVTPRRAITTILRIPVVTLTPQLGLIASPRLTLRRPTDTCCTLVIALGVAQT